MWRIALRMTFWLVVLIGGSPAWPAGRSVVISANNHDGTLSIIDPRSLNVLSTLNVAPELQHKSAIGQAGVDLDGAYADDLAVLPDQDTVVVSRPSMRDIAGYSLRSKRQLYKIKMVGQSDHMAVSKNGTRAYVSIFNEGCVSEVDLVLRKLRGCTSSGLGPHVIHLSDDDSRLYVGTMIANQLNVFDTKSMRLLRSFQFNEGVRPFAVVEKDRRVLVQLTKLHGLVILDEATGAISKRVRYPDSGEKDAQSHYPFTADHGILLSKDGARVCIAATVAGYISIRSYPELNEIGRVQVDGEPSWVINSTDGRSCIASTRRKNTLHFIDYASAKQTGEVKVGDYPQRMWAGEILY